MALSVQELNDRHRYGRSLYGPWLTHAKEQELVWKGDFNVHALREDSPLATVRPSDAKSILKKLDQMLGIRSKKKVAVQPFDGMEDTDRELRLVDRLDRFAQGYLRAHRKATGSDWMRMGMRLAALYGRGPFRVLYRPEEQIPPLVRVETLDPLTTYAVRGHNGFAWYTRETMMTRQALRDFFQGLPEEYRAGMAHTLEDGGLQGLHQVVEYWDETVCTWAVGTQIIDQFEHGYGCLPYREMRLNEMPMDDERWANEGFLGAVLDAVKAKAILKSKLVAAAETSYFPDIFYKTGGKLVKMDPYAAPGDPIEVDEDFIPIAFNKPVNSEILQLLFAAFSGDIAKDGLSELAFALDIQNNVSGFAQSQVLTLIQDAIADLRDQGEQVFGLVMGDAFRLHEVFAPPEGWTYATGDKHTVGRVRAEDIGGHYDIEVGVRVALPQDRLSIFTQWNQAYQVDPATGRPRVDFETAMQITGMDELVEDFSGMRSRIELEWLKNTDESVKQLYTAYVKALNARELKEWQRVVESQQRAESRKLLTTAGREIEQGLSADALIPAEAKTPEVLEQVINLMKQGQTFEGALKLVQEGLNLGVPGQPAVPPEQPPQAMSPETQQLISAMMGREVQMAPEQQPNGLTGYEGISPAALPPAMQGAQPRQVVDQSNVELEQMQQQFRRGALPPPK